MTAFGDTSPEAVLMMREALAELYGTDEPLLAAVRWPIGGAC